jgi:hypothetical protein
LLADWLIQIFAIRTSVNTTPCLDHDKRQAGVTKVAVFFSYTMISDSDDMGIMEVNFNHVRFFELQISRLWQKRSAAAIIDLIGESDSESSVIFTKKQKRLDDTVYKEATKVAMVRRLVFPSASCFTA